MSQVISTDLESLRRAVAGEVLAPGEAGYDEARTVWNGDVDRRPAVIVRCRGTDDVRAALGFARQRDLEISVRGGAHNTSGACVVDDGLMIDLSLMRDVEVDPQARRCRVGGGATLADRDVATQAHGLAAPAGIVGHTGVGGLTLGGGMGWLTRRDGLAVDTLVGAEVVTADGRVLRASADENPDLFWAIRGGGGNFGVVTTFEFRLQPVGPLVHFAIFFWPLEFGGDVLRLLRDLFGSMSRDLNVILAGINAPPEPFVPEEYRFRPGYALLLTGFGGEDEHGAVVTRIREALPPLFDMVTPIPYAQLQQMLDEGNAFGLLAYEKATYVEDLTDPVISVLTDYLPRKTSPRSALFAYRLDGRYSEVADEDTAFSGGRSPRYALFLAAMADDAEALAADRTWVRSLWEALQPHSLGRGGYVNGETELPDDRVRQSYGPVKYARLAQVKARYDPDNVFHLNGNVRPSTEPPRPRLPAG